MPLVISLANKWYNKFTKNSNSSARYLPGGLELDDLISIGYLTLNNCYEKILLLPLRARSSYLYKSIENSFRDAIQIELSNFSIPRTTRTKAHRAKLQDKEPTDSATKDAVKCLKMKHHNIVSNSNHPNNDSDAVCSTPKALATSLCRSYKEKEWVSLNIEAIKFFIFYHATDDEKILLSLKLGLDNNTPHTFDELSKLLSTKYRSRQSVYQNYKNLISRIRSYLESN